MTVEELIDRLTAFDADAEVTIDMGFEIKDIKMIYSSDDERIITLSWVED